MNYTTESQKSETILQDFASLSHNQQVNVFQQLLFYLLRHDKEILIKMLHENGVSGTRIAKALGIHDSHIYRDYLKKEDEHEK